MEGLFSWISRSLAHACRARQGDWSSAWARCEERSYNGPCGCSHPAGGLLGCPAVASSCSVHDDGGGSWPAGPASDAPFLGPCSCVWGQQPTPLPSPLSTPVPSPSSFPSPVLSSPKGVTFLSRHPIPLPPNQAKCSPAPLCSVCPSPPRKTFLIRPCPRLALRSQLDMPLCKP